MDRREFLKLLGSGALMAMVAPSVTEAFQSGKMSEEELFDLLTREGGQGLIVQEADVLAFAPDARRHIRSGTTVKHHYQVTGGAVEQEYEVKAWCEAEVPAVDLSEPRSADRANLLGSNTHMKRKVVASARSFETRKRKFIPGHRVNADGSAFVNPHRVEAKITDEAWENPLSVDLWS